jgi:hypothetical protein
MASAGHSFSLQALHGACQRYATYRAGSQDWSVGGFAATVGLRLRWLVRAHQQLATYRAGSHIWFCLILLVGLGWFSIQAFTNLWRLFGRPHVFLCLCRVPFYCGVTERLVLA